MARPKKASDLPAVVQSVTHPPVIEETKPEDITLSVVEDDRLTVKIPPGDLTAIQPLVDTLGARQHRELSIVDVIEFLITEALRKEGFNPIEGKWD